MTQIVIAVDAVRNPKTGAFTAAAVAYPATREEPLFMFTDRKGVRRKTRALRNPDKLPPSHVRAMAAFIRNSALAVAPYTLPSDKTPAQELVARQVAMLFAVKRAAERLRFCARTNLGEVTPADILVVVAGRTTLRTKQLGSVQQEHGARVRDWRLQAASFYAKNAFQVSI